MINAVFEDIGHLPRALWGTGRGVDRKRYEIRNDGLKGVFTLRFRKLTPRKA
jgi:hypothetical protein